MRKRLQADGLNLHDIPLTSTGYIRRMCKRALQADEDVKWAVKTMLPDWDQYQMLRAAMRGGNTHANRFRAGVIWENVYSYDMSSCYPAQQLTKLYPMGRFVWIADRDLTP